MDYLLTEHRLLAMARRRISAGVIHHVLENPERTDAIRPGRIVSQSEVFLVDRAKVYLVRVVVDIDRSPAEVVTVYRTGRAGRYGRSRP